MTPYHCDNYEQIVTINGTCPSPLIGLDCNKIYPDAFANRSTCTHCSVSFFLLGLPHVTLIELHYFVQLYQNYRMFPPSGRGWYQQRVFVPCLHTCRVSTHATGSSPASSHSDVIA